MSSLRNAVKRRTHKERAQPAERKKHGLLEKHKDYVLRARDFHRKEDTIKALRVKASFRNPDEFYFRMEHTRTRGGVHVQPTSGGKQWSAEELALMRTQDRGYILTKLQAERKKIEKLQALLHGISRPRSGAPQPEQERQMGGKRTKGLPWEIDENGELVVTTQGDENEEDETAAAEEEGNSAAPQSSGSQGRHHVFFVEEDDITDEPDVPDVPSDGQGASAGSRRDAHGARQGGQSELGSGARSRWSDRKVAAAYRELDQRKERAQRLANVLQEMELQKALMGTGRKRKITVEDSNGETAVVYKWARRRQK